MISVAILATRFDVPAPVRTFVIQKRHMLQQVAIAAVLVGVAVLTVYLQARD